MDARLTLRRMLGTPNSTRQTVDTFPDSGPALVYTAREWDAFIKGAKDGELDLS
jgi:hypothetical protein